MDVYVTAPDTMQAGRSYTFTVEAGEATLALEARDSETGQLLGRAIDNGLLSVEVHDLRDFTEDRHRTVDDIERCAWQTRLR